jgi:hypothetical protein
MRDTDEMDVINRPDFVRHSGLPHRYFDRPSLLWPLVKGMVIGIGIVAVLDWLFSKGVL